MSSKEIAAELKSATNTIEAHWKILKARMGARTRTHAVALFLEALRASPKQATR